MMKTRLIAFCALLAPAAHAQEVYVLDAYDVSAVIPKGYVETHTFHGGVGAMFNNTPDDVSFVEVLAFVDPGWTLEDEQYATVENLAENRIDVITQRTGPGWFYYEGAHEPDGIGWATHTIQGQACDGRTVTASITINYFLDARAAGLALMPELVDGLRMKDCAVN